MLIVLITQQSQGFHMPITESQNHLCWKRCPRSLTFDWFSPRQLDHGIKFHFQPLLEHLQALWIYQLPGQPVPKLDDPFHEEILTDVLGQSNAHHMPDTTITHPSCTWQSHIQLVLSIHPSYDNQAPRARTAHLYILVLHVLVTKQKCLHPGSFISNHYYGSEKVLVH